MSEILKQKEIVEKIPTWGITRQGEQKYEFIYLLT